MVLVVNDKRNDNYYSENLLLNYLKDSLILIC
jgi:hypothetical protein